MIVKKLKFQLVFSFYMQPKILVSLLLVFIIGCSQGLELKTKSQAQGLNQAVEMGNRKGERAHDFAVISTDGKAAVLGEVLRNGKPALVYFFATWCPYCHKDLLELSEVYGKYENNVTIIAIDLDLGEDMEKIRKYKSSYPKLQNAIFAPGTSEILDKYQVIKTTTKLGIVKNGTIVYYGFGVFSQEQWDVLLQKLSE